MSHRRTAGLISLAVAARVAYWLATIDYAPNSDAFDYHLIAGNVAKGNGIANVFPQFEVHATAFRPPLFPSALGVIYRVFGDHVGVGRLTNLVIGVFVVLLVERLVSRVGGSRSGLAAAALVAIYPPLVVNDVSILTESLSLLLLLLIVLALSEGRWQLAAVETGLLALTRNSAQLFIVVAAFAVVWWFGYRRALGFVGIATLVLVPWVVRNQVQLGGAVLTTSNGFNLNATYSEEAHASDGFVDAVFDRRFERYGFARFDEIAWDHQLREHGLVGLRNHPGDVFRVSQRNAQAFFELDPHKNDTAEALDGRDPTIRQWALPAFYVVSVTGLLGLWRARRHRATVLLMAAAAYFSLASIVSIAPPRLRAPFDLACCIGVGLLVGQLFGSAGAGPRRSRSVSSA